MKKQCRSFEACLTEKRTWTLYLFALLGNGLLPALARAVDTVETWDPGAMDVEFYAGWDGLGLKPAARSLSADLVIGYGIADRLSFYLATSLQADERLDQDQASAALGLFGTPLHTQQVAVDLLLELGAGGPAFSEVQLTPAFELNLDRDPELRSFGVFLRAGLPITHVGAFPDSGRDSHASLAIALSLAAGAYLTLDERHQLLIGHDLSIQEGSGGHPALGAAGLSMGYNFRISDALELISELSLDLGPGGKAVALRLTTGIIATLGS